MEKTILEQCPVPFLQTEAEISEFINLLQDFKPKNNNFAENSNDFSATSNVKHTESIVESDDIPF